MQCCGRRQMLLATGAIASGAALAGCGGDAADTAAERVSEGVQSASEAASSAVGEASEAVDRLASTADVPVGGGRVIGPAQVVLTQPSAGEFKAFSAVCPHEGCLVAEVQDGEIVCPCHGSRFDIATGDVVAGPAPTGLEEKQVTLDGDGISVG